MKNFWSRHKRILILVLLLMIPVGILYAATTFTYSYPAESVIAQTDGYGGATPDLALDQAYDYTADIDLETNGYWGMWLTLEHDSAGTTDSIVISYFASYDGTNFDDVPLWSVTCDATSGANTQVTFQMFPAPPHGRVGVKTVGTTDTFDYQLTKLPVSGAGS